MKKIVVAGIGTGVGKTVAAAILTKALDAEYWKPLQCGTDRDSSAVAKLVGPQHRIHPESIFLQTPCSPHHAAKREKFAIDAAQIALPKTTNPLVIEGTGGILVPLTLEISMLDLFLQWECAWIIVSRHYLGSINHTLLTLEALKRRGCDIRGIVFNGADPGESEEAILSHSKIPCIGKIQQEKIWNANLTAAYAETWKSHSPFQSAMLKASGTLIPRCKQPSLPSQSPKEKEPTSIRQMAEPISMQPRPGGSTSTATAIP